MPGAQEPLGLDEVRGNLRVDGPDDDARIAALIVAARRHVENVTDLVLTPRTITATAPSLDAFVELLAWPVRAVTAIRYPDAGIMTALAPGSWLISLKTRPARIFPATPGWGAPASSCSVPGLPVEIDLDVGFSTPDDVPEEVRQAMHMLIAHWYEHRTAAEVGARAPAVSMPHGVDALLSEWQVMRV